MKVKEGVMQDSTFINSDQGHARADKPRGPKNQEKQERNLG